MKTIDLLNQIMEAGQWGTLFTADVRIEIVDPNEGVDGPRTWLVPERVSVEERDGEQALVITADINS